MDKKTRVLLSGKDRLLGSALQRMGALADIPDSARAFPVLRPVLLSDDKVKTLHDGTCEYITVPIPEGAQEHLLLLLADEEQERAVLFNRKLDGCALPILAPRSWFKGTLLHGYTKNGDQSTFVVTDLLACYGKSIRSRGYGHRLTKAGQLLEERKNLISKTKMSSAAKPGALKLSLTMYSRYPLFPKIDKLAFYRLHPQVDHRETLPVAHGLNSGHADKRYGHKTSALVGLYMLPTEAYGVRVDLALNIVDGHRNTLFTQDSKLIAEMPDLKCPSKSVVECRLLPEGKCVYQRLRGDRQTANRSQHVQTCRSLVESGSWVSYEALVRELQHVKNKIPTDRLCKWMGIKWVPPLALMKWTPPQQQPRQTTCDSGSTEQKANAKREQNCAMQVS